MDQGVRHEVFEKSIITSLQGFTLKLQYHAGYHLGRRLMPSCSSQLVITSQSPSLRGNYCFRLQGIDSKTALKLAKKAREQKRKTAMSNWPKLKPAPAALPCQDLPCATEHIARYGNTLRFQGRKLQSSQTSGSSRPGES